jgi:hypothetical protein
MKQFFLIAMMVIMTMIAFGQKKDSTGKKQEPSSKIQTPPQQFFIIGTKEEFGLLYKVIADPDNVTKNQTKEMLQWILNKAAIPDSTQKKKN